METRVLQDKLRELIAGDVDSSEDILQEYSVDTSIFSVRPQIVVYPKNTEDIKKLVTHVSSTPGLSLTARAAGTDMTGGPLNTSIIVDMVRYFNKIISVVDNRAVTQPGVFYRDFEKETLKHNLLLPCYTASRELNTVGGMVGNNSGGEKSLQYGKTNRYITRLNVVLSDGNEYSLSKLTRNELEQKKELTTFEGRFYRDLEKMIIQHQDELVDAKPAVSKNSAGYYLWDVYDKDSDTFDMTQLFVGSQGTLGIVTEIEFELITPHVESRMLVMFVKKKNMKILGDLVASTLVYHPESFEAYDDHTFGIVLKVLPSMIKRLGGNIFSLGWQFLPDFKAIVFGGVPKLVLLAEFTGEDQTEIYERVLKAQKDARAWGIYTHVTRSKSDSEKYWVIRRESFNLLRKHVHGKHTAPFIDDVVVRPEKLPEFLPKLYTLLDQYNITYTIAGHVGDGNFHIIPLMNFSRPDFTNIIFELSQRVYDLVVEYDGSITGEHNDGLVRTPYLSWMYSATVIELFENTKQLFDPQNIFNPGKKVGMSQDQMKQYIKHG